MPDVLLRLLLIAAILLVADLVLGGGAMTMTGMSAMAGAFAHPLAAAAAMTPPNATPSGRVVGVAWMERRAADI